MGWAAIPHELLMARAESDHSSRTSTERRIIFSPEILGRRIGSAKPEWEVFGEVAAPVRPELAKKIRLSGKVVARSGLRMMPTFPPPPLSVGSRSGAVSLRFRLPGAPRFLWEWAH